LNTRFLGEIERLQRFIDSNEEHVEWIKQPSEIYSPMLHLELYTLYRALTHP
jgi:hypothetical protein